MALPDDDKGRGASLEAVLSEVERGESASCYLLCGDEEYLLKDALEQLTAALIPDPRDRELNLFATDGEHEEVDALCESLLTPPLLPGRKVIVVRETRLLQSKTLLMPLVVRIRERLERDPARAASDFMHFLQMTGLSLEDLREGGWRKIDDAAWRRIVPDDSGEAREAWLPRAVELCVGRAAGPAKEAPGETDRLERLIAGGMPQENSLILTAETADRRKRLFKAIATHGRILLFPKVKGEARLERTVQTLAAERLAREGKRLSAAAWSAIGQKTGFDLRESLGAVEKLITYAGQSSRIEAEDVEALIGRTKEDTVFVLTGALSERNLSLAIRSLRSLLLDQGEPALRVFAMIAREIRLLFQAHLLIASGHLAAYRPAMDYGRFQKAVLPGLKSLAGDGGESLAIGSQHPFVVFQILKRAAGFSRAELTAYMELLVRTDLALKTTGRDPRLLLERLLIAICKSKAS